MQVELLKTKRFSFINYCPLIVDQNSNSAILIDPAWEQTSFKQRLDELGVQLSAILLTHHHLDHSHLANTLAKEYDVPVYMSQREIDYYDFDCYRLQGILPQQQIITLGTHMTVLVHHTPGHTMGGVCYQIEDNLFTGDTLFNEGCGFCHTRGGCPGMMYESLSHLKRVIDDSIKVYPGHEYHSELGLTFAQVKQRNIYLNIDNKQDFIAFRMQKKSGVLKFR
ncbi:MBL fold metallo-hydrolase [Fluoribacter dumoffii]|uniref:MBL fold metallo-hydrolase n=1 Tax=Fluoribacter dumoffii TaxID=463 RepID=UPI0022436928|nr:MBL fold metallo-hydrolase [Fluoribacter dumoffii]MCW8483267.1 MBL fold metallo-hydrolase [Fluoribacter dumoffii]